MTPLFPEPVPEPVVRRLEVVPDVQVPVQRVAVHRVPSPLVVPRQVDRIGLRLRALQRENEELRHRLDQLRSA